MNSDHSWLPSSSLPLVHISVPPSRSYLSFFLFLCLSLQGTAQKASTAGLSANGDGGDDNDDDPDSMVLYLVKWRGLPYDQSSWEHFRDIRFASDQILDFWDFCRPGPEVMIFNNISTIYYLVRRE